MVSAALLTLQAFELQGSQAGNTMEAKEKIENHDVTCYSAFGSGAKIYQALPRFRIRCRWKSSRDEQRPAMSTADGSFTTSPEEDETRQLSLPRRALVHEDIAS